MVGRWTTRYIPQSGRKEVFRTGRHVSQAVCDADQALMRQYHYDWLGYVCARTTPHDIIEDSRFVRVRLDRCWGTKAGGDLLRVER
jgi:hypothetical protein